jgi:hypothetical protein
MKIDRNNYCLASWTFLSEFVLLKITLRLTLSGFKELILLRKN